MRRLVLPFLVISLAGALLALGACGGDDESSGDQQGLQLEATPPPAPAGPTADAGATAQQGATTGTTGGSKKSRRSRRSGSGGGAGGGNSGSGNNAQEPQEPQSAPQQQSQGNTKREKLNEEIAEALTGEGQAKISYEAARTVCRERKLSEIRATYKPKGKSNEDIAKAVSRVYKPKARTEAAYDGCLKGLSER